MGSVTLTSSNPNIAGCPIQAGCPIHAVSSHEWASRKARFVLGEPKPTHGRPPESPEIIYYARGWMVRANGAGNWWHIGSLPGTTTIMVRTPTGMCWAALCNTRTEPSNEINTALDQMMGNIVRTVSSWGA